ncbi:MarR family winged helix-turn-helix transcriptional regulator, partial [Streptomyces sp. NRRL S-146]|uniref:MarR family winged helix-turn-helix transcriptional regulator n=1 Tax=Streptomyces sp. NRRL S-146 TaxID=1463884 RepID=UPI0004C8B8DD
MTVQDIRSFNRFYTNVIGALDYGRRLYAPYTLTESRVLYELAHAPRTDAADLRAQLHLDAGYLTRILNKFEEDGLVERGPSDTAPRRRRITLTAPGREAAALLDERARETVGAMLDTVRAEDRPRLAEAMRT